MTLARAASIGLVLLIAAPASAQWGRPSNDARAQQFYAVGERHYDEGAYEQAIAQWLAAYQLSPRPLILFNIANAYERLGRVADAIQNLERYRAEAPAEEHVQLDARLEHLRARLGGGGGGEQLDLVVPGVVIGGVGALMVGAGAVFAFLALDARDQIEDPASGACRSDGEALVCGGDASGLFSDAETFALLADIGLIGGGAVLATGLVLVILGATSGGSQIESAALMPTISLSTSGGAAGIVGRF